MNRSRKRKYGVMMEKEEEMEDQEGLIQARL